MRIHGLDFLRGLAILLVLFRHSGHVSIIQDIGWIGVDLFFVLSGFLVSGLLFNEYNKCKNVDIKTFLIRRAFKIYPSFYFFIITCVLLKYSLKDTVYSGNQLLAEIFYLQSYLPSIWPHTWSLAVEEHFYIAFCFWVWLAIKARVLDQTKFVIAFLVVCLVITFLLRMQVCLPHREENQFMFVETHLRMDGILMGVLLAYLFHFTSVLKKIESKVLIILVFVVVLLSPAFIWSGGNFWMNTVGLSMLAVGFSLLVLLAINPNFLSRLQSFEITRRMYKGVCIVGIHSYSIYIWHLIALRLSLYFFEGATAIGTCVYIVFAIALGIFFSLVIEKPFLLLRESVMQRTTRVDFVHIAK